MQQGQIGEFISKKPIQRREATRGSSRDFRFPCAHGGSTEKLTRTDDNIARLTDIMGEVEKQVRSLKRQASRARARNDLKASLREAELELFSTKATRLLTEQHEVRVSSEELGQQLESARGELSEVDARQEELKDRCTRLM